MQKLRRWLEKIYERRITNEYDNIVLVIADEGDGKSNTIVGLQWWWRQIRGIDPTTEGVLGQVAWDRDDFKEMMAEAPQRSAIVAHDASRILHKKKATHPGQIELEEDLFDVRAKEHLIILGFQEWATVPTTLQERRAQHALYLPRRGTVWGYGRDTLDDRADEDEWPGPDLRDTFPALESLDNPIADCWETFQKKDLDRKRERIQTEDEPEDDELTPKEISSRIKGGNLQFFISEDKRDGSLYIDDELIGVEYPDLSERKCRQVRKLLERDEFVQDTLADHGSSEVAADA